jgi:xylan 1,4-beta-xylosidase
MHRMTALASASLLCCALHAQSQAPALTAAASLPAPPASVSVQVDLARTLGPYKPISSWFGYDELNYTTTPNGRKLLRELHDLSPAPVYIRAHHMFTSGDGTPRLKWSSTGIFSLDSAGKPVYNFTLIDQTFDAYRDAGVRPMVELGFMPKDLASGSGPYEVPYPKTLDGSVQSPPKDYAAWGELVFDFTQHLVQRYGAAEVATWYFEVWNEPDISYWHGKPEDYLRLYDYSVANVRKALPNAKVGGPGSTGPGGERAMTFLANFLNHCANDKSAADGKPVPLDFISFHPKGSPKWIGTKDDGHVRMGLSNELNSAANGFRVVSESKFKNTPIILSEADPEGCAACSARQNPANAYRNGPLYPAYTAAAMKSLFDLQDKYGVNLIAMLTWSFEFEDKDYFEGFRTLATNGIDKPVLNVFRMAGMFSGNRVSITSSAAIPTDDIQHTGVRNQADIDAFATRGDHQASIMLWNYHDDDLPAPGSEVTLNLTGIPAGVHKILVEHYRIDATHSNAYAAWQEMGSPHSPTPEQYAQLQAAGQLQSLTSPAWVEVSSSGQARLVTPLPRQATSLLHLSW